MRKMSSKGRGVWFLISICLLIVIVINTSLTVYYYQGYMNKEKQYNEIIAKLEEVSYTVNILIEYNETKVWYNQTIIPIGWSLFNATLKVTDRESKVFNVLWEPLCYRDK